MMSSTFTNTANEIAGEHNITAGRVRQYAAAGRLPRHPGGHFDALYFACMRSGESICASRRHKPAAAVLAALGWLEAGDREDRATFIAVAARNGLPRTLALKAFREARALRLAGTPGMA